MKVSIRDIEKKSGIFSKKVEKGVVLNVALSPEEQQTLKNSGLENCDLASFYHSPWREFQRTERGCRSTVSELIERNGKDISLWFDDLIQINSFKNALKEELGDLKNAIEHFSQPSQPEEFEL